jgi:PAT family acetyl-CoA transporter-like MFS transporter 1
MIWSFSAKWGIPVITLPAYLQFSAMVWYVVSFGLLFKKEVHIHLRVFFHMHRLLTPFRCRTTKFSTKPNSNAMAVYKTILSIWKSSHIQVLLAIRLVAKIGFQTNDAVTSLMMVEKGLGREDLAIAVLIDFRS